MVFIAKIDFKECNSLITKVVSALKTNKITNIDDLYGLLNNLFNLYTQMFEYDDLNACKGVIVEILPRCISLLATKGLDDKQVTNVFNLYEKSYAFAGRRSLEHFIDFMEWDRTSHNKVLANRRNVLKPFIYYLNKSKFDKNIKYIEASFPPSSGKTFVANYYTAWSLGIDIDGSFIRLSYSDDLVQKMSAQIQAIMKDERFGMVFPDYGRLGGKVFDKSKVSDWSTKISTQSINHIARTRDASVTGNRAKTAIILDDMTKGADESTNTDLHKGMYDKWKTDWSSRFDGLDTKFILLGTMWSPDDLLNRIYEEGEMYCGGWIDGDIKYSQITKDGTRIAIKVPLLDENDNSTMPQVYSDDNARFLRDTTDEYLFMSAYQQDPIAPTGLEFSHDNLIKYESLPNTLSKQRYAVLDPTRRGKDFMSLPIFARDLAENEQNVDYWYLLDTYYEKVPMTEAYDSIVAKCIKHNVKYLTIENNTDTSLIVVFKQKFKELNYDIDIQEKYQTVKKEIRIKDARGMIKMQIKFPSQRLYTQKSNMYAFMDTLTRYSFDYPNKHDDAPDSLALFVNEYVDDFNRTNAVEIIARAKIGF